MPALTAQIPGQQIPETLQQGMFSAAPIGIVWADTPTTHRELVVRAPGSNPAQPSPWTVLRFGAATNNHPDYSFGAIFGAWQTTTPVELSDMSTGGDQCPPVDEDGVLLLQDLWYTLSFVVDSNSSGNDGSLIRQKRLAAPNFSPANTVFGYYADGSTGIDSYFIGNTFVEQSSAQLGYGASPTGMVRGLDLGMGIISVAPNRNTVPFFMVRDRFYFAVTPGWVAANSTVQVNQPFGPPLPVNSATIYMSTWVWDPVTGTGTWSEPVVAYSDTELGLAIEEEIDMVSVYTFAGADRVVFSVGADSDRDQILVFQRATSTGVSCPTTALKVAIEGQQETVSRRAGVRPRDETPPGVDPDNVLGGCGTDPEASSATSEVIGVPHGNSIPWTIPVGTSLIKSFYTEVPGDPVSDVLDCEFTGLGVPAGQVGALFTAMSTDGANWTYLPVVVIQPGTTTHTLQMPGTVPGFNGTLSVTSGFVTMDAITGAWTGQRGGVISSIRY